MQREHSKLTTVIYLLLLQCNAPQKLAPADEEVRLARTAAAAAAPAACRIHSLGCSAASLFAGVSTTGCERLSSILQHHHTASIMA
jgi:hypothetical protein